MHLSRWDRRHQRAIDRGYLQACPRGFSHILVPSHLTRRVRAQVDALVLHEQCNLTSHRRHHFLAAAILASRRSRDKVFFRRALHIKKKADAGRHNWDSDCSMHGWESEDSVSGVSGTGTGRGKQVLRLEYLVDAPSDTFALQSRFFNQLFGSDDSADSVSAIFGTSMDFKGAFSASRGLSMDGEMHGDTCASRDLSLGAHITDDTLTTGCNGLGVSPCSCLIGNEKEEVLHDDFLHEKDLAVFSDKLEENADFNSVGQLGRRSSVNDAHVDDKLRALTEDSVIDVSSLAGSAEPFGAFHYSEKFEKQKDLHVHDLDASCAFKADCVFDASLTPRLPDLTEAGAFSEGVVEKTVADVSVALAEDSAHPPLLWADVSSSVGSDDDDYLHDQLHDEGSPMCLHEQTNKSQSAAQWVLDAGIWTRLAPSSCVHDSEMHVHGFTDKNLTLHAGQVDDGNEVDGDEDHFPLPSESDKWGTLVSESDKGGTLVSESDKWGTLVHSHVDGNELENISHVVGNGLENASLVHTSAFVGCDRSPAVTLDSQVHSRPATDPHRTPLPSNRGGSGVVSGRASACEEEHNFSAFAIETVPMVPCWDAVSCGSQYQDDSLHEGLQDKEMHGIARFDSLHDKALADGTPDDSLHDTLHEEDAMHVDPLHDKNEDSAFDAPDGAMVASPVHSSQDLHDSPEILKLHAEDTLHGGGQKVGGTLHDVTFTEEPVENNVFLNMDVGENLQDTASPAGFVYKMASTDNPAWVECISVETLQALVSHTMGGIYHTACLTISLKHRAASSEAALVTERTGWMQWRDGFTSYVKQWKVEREEEVASIKAAVAVDKQELVERLADISSFFGLQEHLAALQRDDALQVPAARLVGNVFAELIPFGSVSEHLELKKQVFELNETIAKLRHLNSTLLQKAAKKVESEFCGYCHSHFSHVLVHADVSKLADCAHVHEQEQVHDCMGRVEDSFLHEGCPDLHVEASDFSLQDGSSNFNVEVCDLHDLDTGWDHAGCASSSGHAGYKASVSGSGCARKSRGRRKNRNRFDRVEQCNSVVEVQGKAVEDGFAHTHMEKSVCSSSNLFDRHRNFPASLERDSS